MGKYTLIIQPKVQRDLQAYFKSGNKAVIKRIEQIFDELAEHPEAGSDNRNS